MWASWRVEMPLGHSAAHTLRKSNRSLVAMVFFLIEEVKNLKKIMEAYSGWKIIKKK